MDKSLINSFFLIISITLLACQQEEQVLIDIEGNTYPIKNYDGTIWMLENLKVKKDQSGKDIKFYFPNDDPVNEADFALLYDYAIACQVCPKGWELPSNADWEKLWSTQPQPLAGAFKDGNHWANEQNTNDSGFMVRPAGYANQGEFDNFFGARSIFWSKTDNSEHIWTFIFEKGKNTIRSAEQHPTYAFSVRCIKRQKQ